MVDARSSELPQVQKRPDGQTDHAYVENLRRQGPVAVDRYGFYWVFSQAHMLKCADPELTRQAETEKAEALGVRDGPVWEYYANALLFSNGAAHQRRRRPLAKTFAYKMMTDLRPHVRKVVEGMIHHLPRDAEIDFLGEIAGPLPSRIVAGILGVPEEDAPRFAELVYPAMEALSLSPSQDMQANAAALGALDDFVTALLSERRAAPGDDFLSRYVGAVEGELDEIEARVQITSVILAGSDTTRMALCSTLSQLLQHPEQWAAFMADPEGLKAGVVAEGLRFDPVIGSIPRVAITDFDLDGVPVPTGAVLSPAVVAVLRDPAVYADPDRFDIHRADHPRYHPVFGAGAHRCLGEALARVELEEALSALAVLSPEVAMVGPPPVLRGLSGARSIDRMAVQLGQ